MCNFVFVYLSLLVCTIHHAILYTDAPIYMRACKLRVAYFMSRVPYLSGEHAANRTKHGNMVEQFMSHVPAALSTQLLVQTTMQ